MLTYRTIELLLQLVLNLSTSLAEIGFEVFARRDVSLLHVIFELFVLQFDMLDDLGRFLELARQLFDQAVLHLDLGSDRPLDRVFATFEAFGQSQVIVLQHFDMRLQSQDFLLVQLVVSQEPFIEQFHLLLQLVDLELVALNFLVLQASCLVQVGLSVLVRDCAWPQIWRLSARSWVVSFVGCAVARGSHVSDLVLDGINLVSEGLGDFF